MQNSFQKVTKKSIVTVSIVGALIVVSVIAAHVSGRTQNAQVVDISSSPKTSVDTVVGTTDTAGEVNASTETNSSTSTPSPEATSSPTNDKPSVTQPSPGVTQVKGKDYTVTIDNSGNTSTVVNPTPAPSPTNGTNSTSVNINQSTDGTNLNYNSYHYQSNLNNSHTSINTYTSGGGNLQITHN